MPIVQMSGRTIGRWKVLGRSGTDSAGQATWTCACECGTERVLTGAVLRSGDSQSCGCLRSGLVSARQLLDLTGQTFGRWTVLGKASTPGADATEWLCQCGCPKATRRDVNGQSLRSGKSQSCGCLRSELRRLKPNVAGTNRHYRTYKNSATRRGLSFTLTRSEFESVTSQACAYCGSPPVFRCVDPQTGDPLSGCTLNGIDRVDNSVGYVASNCVACCYPCNMAKRDMAYVDWIAYLDRLVAFRSSRRVPECA